MTFSPTMFSRSIYSSFRAMSTTSSTEKNDILKNALGFLGIRHTGPPRPPSGPDAPGIPPAEDPLLHYVTSSIMRHGRRAKASRITSKTLLYIHTLTREPPLPIFRQAIELASPAVRVVNNRSSAKTVPTPLPLSEKQRTRYALKWILKASHSKPGRMLEERLAREVIAVVKGDSAALEEKRRVHKSATVNRGNALR